MAKKANRNNLIGGWAFLAGVILALILGFFNTFSAGWMAVLLVIGVVVGLLNIADEESEPFLLSGLVLIIASAFGQSVMQAIPVLNSILLAMLVIFVPATIVVAVRNVFRIARR